MSLRSFTVFQDTPSTDTPKPKSTGSSAPPSSQLSLNPTTQPDATSPTSLTSTVEKENVHPLTGERAGPTTVSVNKKRKTTVLATKVHVPLSVNKQKEAKETQPDAKKRKSSASASSKPLAVKTKSVSIKKEVKGSTRKTVTRKRSTRRMLALPKVVEEDTNDAERERERIAQVDIDSRCYELTVKPLADVSEAYDDVSPQGGVQPGEANKFRPVKASSAEPELRDFFAPSQPSSSRHPIPSHPDLSSEGRSFSTPERKQIYAAFTFASPSPTSIRFSKATRATSIPRLELLDTLA